MQETGDRRCRFDLWVEKIPWRRKWQPMPVFLPGKFRGWRNLAGYSPWGHKVGRNWAHMHAHTHTHTHTQTHYIVYCNPILPCRLLYAVISVHDLTVLSAVSAHCHLFSIVNFKEQRGACLCTAPYGAQHSTGQRSVWTGCSLMTVSMRFWSPSSLFYWTVH